MYVDHTLQILREIRRVLRADGVCFWNVGDSYSGSWGNYGGKNRGAGQQREIVRGSQAIQESYADLAKWRPPSANPENGVKPKDLCLIPARVAIAAQADGWWVRSMIVWAKPNPMPESVTDRPTDAYEYVIVLTKSERYFWDADAVRESASENTHSRGTGKGGPKALEREAEGVHENWAEKTREIVTSRNMRNVWTFPTQPYSGAHFATFPEEIPRRCILAATSTRGACRFCGAPWQRVVRASGGTIGAGSWTSHEGDDDEIKGKAWKSEESAHAAVDGSYRREEIGWRPTCLCKGQRGVTAPCVVLDPFAGSGTTGRVAIELRRRAVLCDLAYARASDEERAKGRAYHDLADARTRKVQIKLL